MRCFVDHFYFIFSRSSIITVVTMLAEQDRHEMECDFQGDLERDTTPRHLKNLSIETMRNARCGLQIWLDICYSISSILFDS